MRFPTLKYHPEAPAAGGTTTTEAPKETLGGVPVEKVEVKASAAPAIDLSTKVKGKDGKEYTVGDLIDSQARVAELTEVDGALKLMYGKEGDYANKEEFEADAKALSLLMRRGGRSADEIGKTVEDLRNQNGFGEKGKGGKQAEADEDSLGNDPRFKQVLKVNQSVVKREIENGITTAMADTQIKSALDALETHSGKEDADSMRMSIAEDVGKTLRLEVGRRMKEAGGFLEDIDWVRDSIKVALDSALKRHAPFFKLVKSLGKSAGAESAFAGLPATPVKAPMPKGGEKLGDVRAELEAWSVDTLMRAAQRAMGAVPA